MNKAFALVALLLATAFFAPSARAVDGLYLGGQIGAVGISGTRSDTTLGFDVDLGLRANSIVDVVFHFQTSSHPGRTVYAPHLSAEIHYADVNDFDFTIGVGPGLYFFKNPAATDTNFGLNFGTAVDLKVDEAIRLGLGARYHLVFSPTVGDNFWSFMFRAGYFFEW